MSLSVNNDDTFTRRRNTFQKSQNIRPISINSLLSSYKITTLKNVIKKFNKLYTLCKSKKIDKLQKYRVISHRLNTIIKKRVVKSLKREYKQKIKKYKRKIRKKSNKQICEKKLEVVIHDEDIVRDKIREQLDLLRNFKRTIPNPLLTLKTKINSKRESPIPDSIKSYKLEIVQPSSPKPSTSFEIYENISNKVENFLNNLRTPPEETDVPKQINHILDNNSIIDTLENSLSLIKPTKTNDITKIKGWRGKQFLKTNSEPQPNPSTNNIENKTIDKSMDFPEMVEISTKSAFESEALDMFLTNAKLNISYEVPKLIAEEAISKIEDFNVMSKQNQNQSSKQNIKSSDKKCKAKTLAEKRKMIENDRQKDLLHEMEINETTLLKQLKRDEKRHRVETINEIRKTLTNQLMPISRECWKTAMKSENNHSISQVIINGSENIQITGSYGDFSIRLNKNVKRNPPNNLFHKNVQIVDEISFKEIKPNYKTMFGNSCNKYRPGPLSKKPFLDKLKNNNWETVIVSLPKIILEVHSEYGKQMDPKIQPYLQTHISEKGFISDLWANFAASAVNRDNKNSFDFPLKYSNNQQKVLMKKKKIVKKPITIDLSDDDEKNLQDLPIEKTVESEVNLIINDMLKYVDTPVLDNSNIDYCPDCPKFEESKNKFTPTTHVSEDVHAILSASRKRKLPNVLKTERELKRLSVQVIEVDMQNETKAKRIRNENCLKIECRMGCVCYDSDVEWPQHCGREACILQCECRSIKISDKQRGHQYISLPEGSNLLSAKTMGHIRDQANKNLAKEERKFTQTVIKANDQTIVVGEGCRERRKRVTKVPQKYTEYIKYCAELKKIHNIEEKVPEEIETSKRSMRIWASETKPSNPVVKSTFGPPTILKQEIIPILDNMIQLKNVLPWCMVHHLYKCFCNGQALEDILTQKSKKINMEKDEENVEDYISYTSKRTYAAANPFANSDVNVCARIRGVPNFYLNRNKSQFFKTRNIEIYEKEKENSYFNFVLGNSVNDDELEIGKSKCSLNIENVDDSLKPKEKINKIKSTVPKQVTSKEKTNGNVEGSEILRSARRKRMSKKYSDNEFIAGYTKLSEKSSVKKSKPSLDAVPIDNKISKKESKKNKKLSKLNISKKTLEQATKSNVEQPASNEQLIKSPDARCSLLLTKKCVLPDLLIPMPHIQSHFHTMVFKTSPKHTFRLMHWEKLNEHFHKSTIFIWYNPKGVGGKLIATNLKSDRPSEEYIDVKYFKNLTTELPDVVKGLIQGKLPGRTFDAKNTYGIFVFTGQWWEIRGTILKKPSDSPIIREEGGTINVSKVPDVKSDIKELHLESKEVPLIIAEPELHCDTDTTASPASIRVPIPIGTKDSRWFMLILENDFSILRIANSPVLVKYAQLKQACQFAMRVARTVRFLIPRVNKQNDNILPAYGGYAVPGLLERVFFGPYDLVESHGILTYRYLNGKLVDTKLVDRLTGTTTKKSKGIWLYTKGVQVTGIDPHITDDIPIVDLTDCDDVENTIESPNQKWDSIEGDKSNSIASIDSVANNPSKTLNTTRKSNKTDLISNKISNSLLINKTNNPSKFSNNPSSSSISPSNPPELSSNKMDVAMPVLEKIDAKVTLIKVNKEMPTLQPIAPDSTNINPPIENNSKETPSTNPLPIYYNSRRNPAIKRKRKSQLQEICNDDDLEIISSTISTRPKERRMWLVSEPRNLGYIEIKTHTNGTIGLKSPINQQEIEFNEMSAAINWIDKLLRKFVHFVPIDFQIRMFLVEDEKALMNRQPLKEPELRGYHVICKKGLFDLTELTANDIDDLGISIREREKLLERQPTLILQKFIYKLGDTFLPIETMRSMLHETIINMASPSIRRLQKENIRLKKEKRDHMIENQRLQNKLNELSKSLSNGDNDNMVDVDVDDDEIIIIEDNDDHPQDSITKVSTEMDPLALPEDNLIISNVTSLADNYIDNDHSDTPILESIKESCKIVDGKVQKESELPPPKLTPIKKSTSNKKSKNPIPKQISSQLIQKNNVDNTQTPVYAPVVLPDGRSILIPIEPSNSDTKLVVSDNQSKKYKIRITPISSRKKSVSLLNNALKSNTQQNSTITAPPLKSLTVKSPSKLVNGSQSILKKNSNNSDTSMESEIIEID